jgi:hypothetical protein
VVRQLVRSTNGVKWAESVGSADEEQATPGLTRASPLPGIPKDAPEIIDGLWKW